MFQSTHPHGVRLDNALKVISVDRVSIHAPTRGATCNEASHVLQSVGFQSTHPHGVRHIAFTWFTCIADVSIHAPTRGATFETFTQLLLSHMFQSTHPHGVRPKDLAAAQCNAMFQSTHPHGVRHGIVQGGGNFDFVSIHAPTRGATKSKYKDKAQQKVSIHAPTRGATCANILAFLGVRVSIHAPTRGATLKEVKSVAVMSFNPRTHTGCDYGAN